MKQRIAVEPSLTQVVQFLESKGCSVETLSSNNRDSKADAYVVTGLNSNLMSVGITETKAPVIDATGLTAEQVYRELQDRLDIKD